MVKSFNGAMKHSKESTTKKKITPELFALLGAVAVVGRLVPHPANITPVGGLSIWGGTRLNRVQALALVFGAMLISDFFIGFHATIPQVYIGMAIVTLLASLVKRVNPVNVVGVTLLGSVIFFLITNFNYFPWQTLHMYPQTWAGQMAAYTAALPFLRNSLIGDVGYMAVFYGIEWIAHRLYNQQGAVKTI